MRPRLIVTIILILFVVNAISQSKRDQDWIDDIRYAVKRIEIMHPKMYANISESEFKANTEHLISNVSSQSDSEIVLGIAELLAGIRDGHTNLGFFQSDADFMNEHFHSFPITIYPFSDGLYIVSAAAKYKKWLGRKVLRIGEQPSDEAVKRILPIIMADNQYTSLKMLPYFINIAEILKYYDINQSTSELSLELENEDGEIEIAQFKSQPYMSNLMDLWRGFMPGVSDDLVSVMNYSCKSPTPLWLSKTSDNYWFTILEEDDAIFLQINSLNNKEDENFEDFINRMFSEFDSSKSHKLIIDLRLNDGGNHIEMPLFKGILARPLLDKPENLFLLTSRVTYSGAQHVTSIISRYTNATLMGEPTSGSPNHYGAVRPFPLLNHKEVKVRSSIEFYQDGQPYDFSICTEPDYFVSLSSSDFKANRDPVMEKVFEYDTLSRMRLQFKTIMTKAYEVDGLEGLQKVYYSTKSSYKQMGFNLENLLYDDLVSWMYENKEDNAEYIKYLKFVQGELPNSIEVCYYLGTWLEKYISKEEAKKMYERSLFLNPEHDYARMKIALMEL